MRKAREKTPGVELRPVYLRMTPELVAWLDAEAKRQRRSRAFVVSQAVRLMRATFKELEEQRTA
jgi:predicted transcriptional regulator